MDCERFGSEAFIAALRSLRGICLLALVGALPLSAGCGSFENRHFYEGEGEVAGNTTPAASVFVVGHPELATQADADGAFVVSGVPAGLQALVISSGGKARLREIRTVADQRAELGELRPDQQGRVVGTVSPGALVFLPGTDFATRADEAGAYRLEGLPAACLGLVIAGEGSGEACVRDGEEVWFDFESSAELGRLSCEEEDGCEGTQVCRDGLCAAAECRLWEDCPAAFRCEAARCVPGACACGPGPSEGCAEGLECVDGCDCRPTGCVFKGPETCDGLDDDCDGEIDEDVELKGPCGPPDMCGEGSLRCMGPRGFRCETAPEELACRGMGPTLAAFDLRVSEGSGLDLDDADGDGNVLTGVDNQLGRMRPLAELLEMELRRGLRMSGGAMGAYLIELSGLSKEGEASTSGAASSLRLFVGYPDEDGLGYVVAPDRDGVYLHGQLPLERGSDGSLLAGPSQLELRLNLFDGHGGAASVPTCAEDEGEPEEREPRGEEGGGDEGFEACLEACAESGGEPSDCRDACAEAVDCRPEGRDAPGRTGKSPRMLPLALVWARVPADWDSSPEVELRVGAAIALEALLDLIRDRDWRRSVELLLGDALDVDTDRDGVYDSISLGLELHTHSNKPIVHFKSDGGR